MTKNTVLTNIVDKHSMFGTDEFLVDKYL